MIRDHIIVQYLFWHYLFQPKRMARAWKNIFVFNLYYFSIPLLLKTLFSPWHRYQWRYERGLDIHEYLEIFVSNIVSRVMGALVRISAIVLGMSVQIAILLGGIMLMIIWILLPVLLLALMAFGIRLLL